MDQYEDCKPKIWQQSYRGSTQFVGRDNSHFKPLDEINENMKRNDRFSIPKYDPALVRIKQLERQVKEQADELVVSQVRMRAMARELKNKETEVNKLKEELGKMRVQFFAGNRLEPLKPHYQPPKETDEDAKEYYKSFYKKDDFKMPPKDYYKKFYKKPLKPHFQPPKETDEDADDYYQSFYKDSFKMPPKDYYKMFYKKWRRFQPGRPHFEI